MRLSARPLARLRRRPGLSLLGFGRSVSFHASADLSSMARDANIPIFLWVATAALAHILWGGGAEQVAQVIEHRTTVNRFARSVQGYVQRSNSPIEVTLLEDALELEPDEPAPSSEGTVEEEPEALPDEPDQQESEVSDSKREQPAEQEDNEPEPAPPPKPKPKADEPQEPLPDPVTIPAQPIELDRRVAIDQHVQDTEQEDNPDAEFIGEHSNRVKAQTQARITSTDQNEVQTSLDSDHFGPSDAPGSSDVNDLAQSQDAPGDPEQSPSESDQDGVDKAEASPAKVPNDPSRAVYGESAPKAVPNATDERPRPASKGQTARKARAELEAAPKILSSPDGTTVVPAEREAQTAQNARKAKKQRRQVVQKPKHTSPWAGRGALRDTPGGLNPNLTPLAALNAIGEEQLQRERLADGARRRSKHRGSWRAIGLERWKSAIENYVSSVKPGNQTALNTAKKPFARYLNHIHNRLHPEFAHSFLGSLDSLPVDHPLNRKDRRAHLEIILSAEDGRVVQMGITRASGVTAFDVGALEAVQDASPFGAPPREIVSPDGRVYLHWEFHRDPVYACSTYFARPYILRVAPTPAAPPAPSPPGGTTPQDGKHGKREPRGDKARPRGG